MRLKKACIAHRMLITRTRRSLLRLVLEQHDFTKSLAVLWTFCENGAKCQQSTLLARLGNHRRSAETARGLAYACKTYLDGIRLIRDRRKKPVFGLVDYKSLHRMQAFSFSDKSAHNEIRDFYAHMALSYERHFARCFCRYSGNIAMRYFLSNKILFKHKCHPSLAYLCFYSTDCLFHL